MQEVLLDAVWDALKTLPFLFGAYLLMEFFEHRWEGRQPVLLAKLGPVGGAVLGCVPQCGFSVAAANFYAARLITPGTLLAVFLATSDEALLILLSRPGALQEVARLLGVKVAAAIALGLLADLAFRRFGKGVPGRALHELCEHEHCGCGTGGILRPALTHTARIFLFLLFINAALGCLLYWVGEGALSRLLLGGSVFQPLLAAFLGFIPNCAASVLLTELYLAGSLSFGSAVAGLCTGAGLGLAVLFRVNRPQRENFILAGVLYAGAVATGLLCSWLFPGA